ncbi:MAG: helix-turn-helix transcriptional regulator [Phascolarctobacterium sp.]|nr:helix-turn-helix transcriptional regulator [Phascolarctobacterium sp.]
MMKENFKLLGRRVKYMRMDKGISQTNMAEMLGLSQTNLSNMEGGRTAITTQNLFKMQEIMGCKIADFFVDFDSKFEEASESETEQSEKQALELEDAVKILKLLKAVDIKGL